MGVTEFYNPVLSTMMIVEGGSGSTSNPIGQAAFILHASRAHILKPEIDRAYFTLDNSENVISSIHSYGHSTKEMAASVQALWGSKCN